jgi:menaquinone-9 beta-reductase
MPAESQKTDVFVVGGGPAGLAAALAARQRGFEVAVADLNRPPIDKACGEGLMPDSVAALRQLGVDLGEVESGSFCGIRFLGEEGSVEADFPHGCGIGIRRTLLHEKLVDCAGKAGVKMLWGARVSAVKPSAVLVDGRAVSCRWIVGADGQNSQVRRWAGLSGEREFERRIGLRQHFAVRPWSVYVEVYWGERSQAYVTPLGEHEVGVALLTRPPVTSFDVALDEFASLRRRLAGATACTAVKGAPTVTRKVKRVARDGFALVGDASGSVDAITGEGLGMSFRQAIALAAAMKANDLARYQAAHEQICARPRWMARTLLLMAKSARVRRRALRALGANPALFQRLLAVHVGELPLRKFVVPGALDLGWGILTA